jgi:hypothetical protein
MLRALAPYQFARWLTNADVARAPIKHRAGKSRLKGATWH